MPLTVHRAHRLDTLAGVLAGTLAAPPADPLQRELVAVPSRGVGRWLSQQLAGRFGIAANIGFPTPEAMFGQVTAAVDPALAASPDWGQTALLWHVLAVLDDELRAPELAVLASHLGADAADDRARRGRRLATAATLTRLFVAYGRQRPAMLAEWAAGADTDGALNPLPESMTWQPWLWRRVRARIGVPHPAERLDALVARLREQPAAAGLPDRLAVFGATRLPGGLLTLLAALGEHRQVDVYLPYPSDLPLPERPAHPLLASCAREVQGLQTALADLGATDRFHPGPPPARPTLLSALQRSLSTDTPGEVPGEPDGSIEIHSCHGPSRQVEVLRDRLLHLFAGDETLQPRDVLVVCPDLDTYGPLIRGAFGADGGPLRVRLADRGLRETNAVLDVLAALLDLAADRVRAGELLDLAAAGPVRQRFGFSDDDLETLADWVPRSGIRWGIDGTQRSRFNLEQFRQGTAHTGVDRIALGVAADESDLAWLATALPLSGIESTKAGLAGRFAEFVELLGGQLARMTARQRAAEWSDLLTETIELLTETPWELQWQEAQALRLITGALAQPGAHDGREQDWAEEDWTGEDGGPSLVLSDIRELIGGLLADRSGRSDFCTGELTVCPMRPMRSVPHRVIVLLGMDGAVFPRPATVDGDDILAVTSPAPDAVTSPAPDPVTLPAPDPVTSLAPVAPRTGEPGVRDEDRQTFLDAVTAVTERLLVFYTGTDPVTAAVVPPATVVSELQDLAGPGVVVRHTLHAFDEANFRIGPPAGPAGMPRPFSFDPALLGGARARSALNRGGTAGTPPTVIADAVLPAQRPAPDVELAELIAFYQCPAEAFATGRLGLDLRKPEEASGEQLAVTLDGLERWGIGQRYLTELLHGVDPLVAQGAEQRRGTLPPFQLGAEILREITEKAAAIATVAEPYRTGTQSGAARDADVALTLPDGRRLTGTVGDLFGHRHVTVTFSGLKAKHKIEAWIRLLALNAGGLSEITEAVLIGGGRARGTSQRCRLTAPPNAAALLNALVAVRDAGLTRPLGLTLEAGAAAAAEFRRSGAADRAERRARYRYGDTYGDNTNRYLRFVFTGDPAVPVDFDVLRNAVPEPADLIAGGTWLPGDESVPMYVRLAAGVYGPMTEYEDT